MCAKHRRAMAASCGGAGIFCFAAGHSGRHLAGGRDDAAAFVTQASAAAGRRAGAVVPELPPGAEAQAAFQADASAGSGARAPFTLAGLVGPAALGTAVALSAARRGTQQAGGACRKRRAKRCTRTQRRFFESAVQTLNPFYESPADQTKKRYSPVVDEINALEATFKAKSDDELRAETQELQKKAADGQPLEALLPRAFALVREASWRVLGLRPFDVQLIGGCALHDGNIAEMGTGEGKTLVAILPAFLNALSGKGVHVVTVNDYLARRDAEWVGQPLRFLGMTVGVVQGGMVPEQRRQAYRSDVTYVTNSELGFDYLRDQMAASPSDLCLREKSPFNFAIVDEVDSILVDEARTPLIISGVTSEPSSKYTIANEVANALRRDVHYTVDEKQRQCVLIEDGVEAAETLLGKDDLFDPQDPWFPFLVNAVNAKEINVRDKQYIVRDGEVLIVDEFTGRVMDGRRWNNGLHQAVEAKEKVPIQPESVTMASISYQSLFRLFGKLSGMTGTAFTEAKEFEETYKLKTLVIPPNRPRLREDLDDVVYADDIGKWKSIARDVENSYRIGRPVLIGTTNVENSEVVAELLDALGVPYQLLNAKPENVARETEIIAASGRKYAVTIATNMAGRGTDILLGGNNSMMGRLRLRESLYKELFPDKAEVWEMPREFYPIELSQQTQDRLSGAVRATVQAWRPEAAGERPTTLDAAERIVEAELTELEAEERLSLACEKAPTEDPVLLGLREAYNLLCEEYKQVTDLEKREVVALGGLYVLGTERHESRRIDNQLRGRCARQGDPGSTRFYLSLNDTIFRIFGGEQIKKMMSMMSFTGSDDTPLQSGMLSGSLEEAQKKVENYYYSVRKNVFEYDDVMDTQRKIIYDLRRRALLDTDESIRETMYEFVERNMEDFVKGHIDATKPVDKWLLGKLAENVGIFCAMLKDTVTEEALRQRAAPGGQSGEIAVSDFLLAEGKAAFTRKVEAIEDAGSGLTGMVTRQLLLMQIDQFWQQHLKNMDFMRSGVTLRAYSQKTPLTEYKLEGYQVFLKMMSRIRRNAVYNLFLFMPRKLREMPEGRIRALIPPRDVRRRQVQDVKMSNAYENRQFQEAEGSGMSRTVNLARLAINVRQLLEAREGLKELALASFGELKDSFVRAGLLTLGDQLRWASACQEFKLMEDEMAEEIYIGLRQGVAAGAESQLAEDQKAREVFQEALDNPEFVATVDQFSQNPEEFLRLMQQSTEEADFDAADAEKMRQVYKAAGMDIDETLKEMTASLDQLPPAQRQVVEYMAQLLSKGKEGAGGEEAVKAKESKPSDVPVA